VSYLLLLTAVSGKGFLFWMKTTEVQKEYCLCCNGVLKIIRGSSIREEQDDGIYDRFYIDGLLGYIKGF